MVGQSLRKAKKLGVEEYANSEEVGLGAIILFSKIRGIFSFAITGDTIGDWAVLLHHLH